MTTRHFFKTVTPNLVDGGSIDLTGSLALYNNAGSLDVYPASSTQAGVITSTQFKDLSRTVAASAEPVMVTTTGTGHVDVAIPVTPLSTVVLVTISVRSVSNASGVGPSGKWCVTHAKFALRRGASGDSVLIGNTVHLFKQADTAGIAGLYVEGLTGTAGADQLRIYGVSTFNIDHYVVVTTQYLPNPVSA